MFSSVEPQLRRSFFSWAAIPMAAVWVVIALLNSADWNGSWLSALSYTATSTAFMLIPIGAIVGLESSRRRSTLDQYLDGSQRSRAVVASLTLLTTLMTATALALVVYVSTSIFNMSSGSSTASLVGLDQVAYATCIMLLLCVISFGVGMITPSPTAGAGLGLLAGIILGFFADIPLSTAQDVRMSSSRIVLAVAIFLLAAIALLIVNLVSDLVDPSRGATLRRITATVVFVGSLGVSVNSVALGGDLRVENPPPSRAACSDTAPNVCVWPDHRGYLPRLTEMTQDAKRVVAGNLAVPATFNEFGLTPGRDATYSFSIQGESSVDTVTAGGLAGSIINTSFLRDYCDPRTAADAKQRSDGIAYLHFWLHARITGEPDRVSDNGNPNVAQVVRRVLRGSDDTQLAWVQQTSKKVREIPCAAK